MQKYHHYKTPSTQWQTITILQQLHAEILQIQNCNPTVKPDCHTSTIACRNTTNTNLQPMSNCHYTVTIYFSNNMQRYHYYKTSTQCQTRSSYFNNNMQPYHLYKTSTQCQTITILQQ